MQAPSGVDEATWLRVTLTWANFVTWTGHIENRQISKLNHSIVSSPRIKFFGKFPGAAELTTSAR